MVMANKSELEGLVKQVTSATSGFLRDGLLLFKKGAKEEEFHRMMEAFETVKNDRSVSPAFINHMEALGAILPAFAVGLLPSSVSVKDHLSGCKDSMQFYANRILKAAKERNDERDGEWVKALNALIDSLINAASENLAGGNKSREILEASKMQNSTETIATKSIEPIVTKPTTPANHSDNNPTIATTTIANNKSLTATQAPILEGDRWYLRQVTNMNEPIIVTPEAHNQAVVLEDCQGAAVQVSGKIKGLTIDHCQSVDVELVGDVIANVEILASRKIKLYLTASRVPTVVLDECEGVQLMIGPASRDVKIFTSKCCEINISMPASLTIGKTASNEDDEDFVEVSLPAQFVSYLSANGKIVTEPASHIGA